MSANNSNNKEMHHSPSFIIPHMELLHPLHFFLSKSYQAEFCGKVTESYISKIVLKLI